MNNQIDESGKDMWNMLSDDDFAATGTRKTRRKLNKQEFNIRTQLKKLQKNSQIVVDDCKEKLEKYKRQELYFKANEARIAGMIHTNFIQRLQQILDGESIFDRLNEFFGDDEEIIIDTNIE